MFSATKLVIAGAVVTMFGGFLLTGVFTQQPSDEPLSPAAVSATSSSENDAADESLRSDILPGVDLVTEEVEPGVYRVLNDGVRDLSRTGERTWGIERIAAGPDGSIWTSWGDGWGGDDLDRGDGAMYRIGSDRDLAGWPVHWTDDVEVGPDGVLWASGYDPRGSWLRSSDGIEWFPDGPPSGLDIGRVEIDGDGIVWATGSGADGGDGVYRLGRHGWEHVAALPEGADDVSMGLTDAGEVWLGGSPAYYSLRDDGSWRKVTPEEMTEGGVSVDGSTRWTWTSPGRDEALVRLDASGSTSYAVDDSLPVDGFLVWRPNTFLPASPDGAVWLRLKGEDRNCGGIGKFDGATLTRFLRDSCVYTWDVDPTGSVWLIAGHDGGLGAWHEGLIEGPFETYVITPEAMAGTE